MQLNGDNNYSYVSEWNHENFTTMQSAWSSLILITTSQWVSEWFVTCHVWSCSSTSSTLWRAINGFVQKFSEHLQLLIHIKFSVINFRPSTSSQVISIDLVSIWSGQQHRCRLHVLQYFGWNVLTELHPAYWTLNGTVWCLHVFLHSSPVC